jgi:hypothetical protein
MIQCIRYFPARLTIDNTFIGWQDSRKLQATATKNAWF